MFLSISEIRMVYLRSDHQQEQAEAIRQDNRLPCHEYRLSHRQGLGHGGRQYEGQSRVLVADQGVGQMPTLK
jgi:hypothetical protein